MFSGMCCPGTGMAIALLGGHTLEEGVGGCAELKCR